MKNKFLNTESAERYKHHNYVDGDRILLGNMKCRYTISSINQTNKNSHIIIVIGVGSKLNGGG
jgi:hypothetical protein